MRILPRRCAPYLGETLDCGMATLFAEEILLALRYINGLEPAKDPTRLRVQRVYRRYHPEGTWASSL